MYTLTNIGGVGGSRSEAFAVSVQGAVAGTALDREGRSHGFLYEGSANAFEDDTDFRGINSDGAIVGTYQGYATVWNAGVAKSLGTLGDAASVGIAVNDLGYVTGGAGRADEKWHAFLYSNGQMIDLGTLGGGQSDGYALNDAGQVAGTSETTRGQWHAFLWDRQTGMRDLGTLGGRESRAMAINSQGAVAGAATNQSRYFHATVWSAAGEVIDLGTLGGGNSYAYDLNNAGLVVGYSYDSLGRSRAFVWSGGMLFDLNDLVSNAAGWSLTAAYGINQSGQIVGTGFFNGQSAAFRLDPVAGSGALTQFSDSPHASLDVSPDVANPVPEPAGLTLVGLGTLLVWQRRHALQRRS